MITRSELEQMAVEFALGDIEIVERRHVGVQLDPYNPNRVYDAPSCWELYAGPKGKRRYIEIAADATRAHMERCLQRMIE